MWKTNRRMGSLSLFTAVSLSAAVLTGSGASALQCELPQINEGRTFVVEAWGVPDTRFNVGEPLRLQMRVSSPSFLSLYHIGTSCKVTRLVHNFSMQPTEIVDFPLSGSGIQVVVKPPAGNEAIHVITTRTPLEFLSGADILSGSGDIASLDLNPEQYFRRLNDALGRINPYDWSVTTLLITVVAH